MSAIRSFHLICMKALGVFFALVGGMLLVQFPSYYRSEVAFEANAISATGTVVNRKKEIEYSGGGLVPLTARTKYISTVEFQTREGESIRFTTSGRTCSSRRDCENNIVQVQYDPSLPKQARIYSDTALNVRVGSYGVLSLIFFSIGIGLLVIDPGDRPTNN